jgi:hypothetical protein
MSAADTLQQKSDATHVARLCVLRLHELELLDDLQLNGDDVLSLAFSLGKQRYAARLDGIHSDALSGGAFGAAASGASVDAAGGGDGVTMAKIALDYATSFAYLHAVKSPTDELRILLQSKSGKDKAKASKKSTNYVTHAYATIDMHELVQAPAHGTLTLFKVVRPEKRSVRSRLRGAAVAGSASATTGAVAAAAAPAPVAASAGAPSATLVSSSAAAAAAAASGSAALAPPLGLAGVDLDLDDSDDERDAQWTDLDGTTVGRDTGNKRDTLGAPMARLSLRIATVAAGNERADEFESAADQLDEGGVPAAALLQRDDVAPEAIGADEDDQLVASLPLVDRVRYRVENQTKGEKGPGKFRKWATKLRKRPTVDEKRQSKDPASWMLSDDDSDNDDQQQAHLRSARSVPVAIPHHQQHIDSVASGSPPNDATVDALSDDDDDSSGAPAPRRGGELSLVASVSAAGDDSDDDGIGAVAAIARSSNKQRTSKSLLTSSKAAAMPSLWKAGERNCLALLNTGRRSAAVVAELWRSSSALSEALPLMTYKDSGELATVLANAIDKRDESAQRADSMRPLSVMIVGDDKDVSDVVRPFLEIAAKKRRTWQPVEFWLVPIGKQRELANQIAGHDATYRALFFGADWVDFFQPTTQRDSAMCAGIVARIAQYATEARAARAFPIAEALLTLDKASGGDGNLQLTVPVLRQVTVGQRDSGEPLPLRLDYWLTSEKKQQEKKELKPFQYVAIQRLEAAQGDLLTLVAQKAGKKGLARKMITAGRSDKDADAVLTCNVNKALVAAASEKETFVVAIDDIEWPHVKFVSIDPRWAGHVKQLAIQVFE